MTEKMPLPIVLTSREEAAAAWGGIEPNSPLGIAFLWLEALEDPAYYANALGSLSLQPSVWGDFTEVASVVADLAVLSRVQDTDDPDIKHVRLIPYAGEPGRVVEQADLSDSYYLTVVFHGGQWHVWGLSHNRTPDPSEVRR